MAFLVLTGVIVAGLLAWIIHSRIRKARRERLFSQPLPAEHMRILEDKVSLYSILLDDLRLELHGRINIFLDEKKFIGCGGLTITDEMRLTIAGNACILLLNRDTCAFPGFQAPADISTCRQYIPVVMFPYFLTCHKKPCLPKRP